MAKGYIGDLELWIAQGEAIVLTPPEHRGGIMAFTIAFLERSPLPAKKIIGTKPVKNPPKWAIIPADSIPGFGWRKASWDEVPKDLPSKTAKWLIKYIFEGDV